MDTEMVPNFGKKTVEHSKRNSNIEWLRIISMLLIVAYHSKDIQYPDSTHPLLVDFNNIILGSWGLLGVDLFLVISAWFLCSQKFRAARVISLVFQTFSWVFGYAIFAVGVDAFHWHNGLDHTATILSQELSLAYTQPLWCGKYWFITAYFFMVLISPLLNKLLTGLSKQQLSKVLLLFVFIPIYAQFQYMPYRPSPVCDIATFVYIYLLVGFIKIHGSIILNKFAKARFYVLLIGIVIVSKCVLSFDSSSGIVSGILHETLRYTTAVTGRHSLVMLLIALLIFFDVVKKPATSNNFVNGIASHTLGVYLFHETKIGEFYALNLIFNRLINLGIMTVDLLFPLRYLVAVLGIFTAGILCEWIRYSVLQKPFMKWITGAHSAKLESIDNWFNNF